MAYRQALPDGRESSEFLVCACCFARVTDDGSDTIGRTTPKLAPQRISERGVLCKDDQLTRKRERAWRIFKNERERAWRFCYFASGTKFPLSTTGESKHPRRVCDNDRLTRERELGWLASNWTSGANLPFTSQNINTGTLEDQHLSAEDGIVTLEPPEDKSIKTLVIHGLNSRIHEQNIIDKFAAYGVIKSISFFAEESRALVTYTTREGADKATQALSKWLFINGQKLKLAWGSPHEPPMNRPSAMDLGSVISTQEVGGSSTASSSSSSSSNMPIICRYCRATAAAVENESDTRELRLRLSMLNDYQCPRGAMSFIPACDTQSEHQCSSLCHFRGDQRLEPPQDHKPDQDSAQGLGGSSTSENNEAPPSQDEYLTNPK